MAFCSMYNTAFNLPACAPRTRETRATPHEKREQFVPSARRPKPSKTWEEDPEGGIDWVSQRTSRRQSCM